MRGREASRANSGFHGAGQAQTAAVRGGGAPLAIAGASRRGWQPSARELGLIPLNSCERPSGDPAAIQAAFVRRRQALVDDETSQSGRASRPNAARPARGVRALRRSLGIVIEQEDTGLSDWPPHLTQRLARRLRSQCPNDGTYVALELGQPAPGHPLRENYLTSTGETVPRPGLPQSSGGDE